MVFKVLLGLSLVWVIAQAIDTTDHSKDPSFYRCPFRIFNSGMPLTSDNGEVMYCDVENARCPSMHFCSYGYEDDRSVCCHILGA